MTGTITDLNTDGRVGSIRAGDGCVFNFCEDAVLAGRFSFLRLGQEVKFDAGRGVQARNAVRVHWSPIPAPSPATPGGEKPLAPSKASGQAEVKLLYAGFEQPANIRHYKFSAVSHGQPPKLLTVSVDLALFLKYHVGLQEAPALCFQKLSRADPEAVQIRHELTDRDLAGYASDRAAAAALKLERRKWPKSRRMATPPHP